MGMLGMEMLGFFAMIALVTAGVIGFGLFLARREEREASRLNLHSPTTDGRVLNRLEQKVLDGKA
jgi:hypothetical protein